MKRLTFLLFSLAMPVLFGACDKTKEDVLPDSFNRLTLHNDYYTMLPYATLTLDVLANDTVAGNARLTMGEPAHGSLQPAAIAGRYVYQPESGFTGTESFSYTVCIGQNCQTAQVTIVVDTPPCMLDARPDSVTTPYQQPVLIPVLGNDQTCGLVTLTVRQNKRGLATLQGNQILFTPLPGVSGRLSLTYLICNATSCDSALVDIMIGQPMLPPPCGLVTRPDTLNITSLGTGITTAYIPVLANDLYCHDLGVQLEVYFPGYTQYGWAEIDPAGPPNHIKYSTSFSGFYINFFTYRVCQTINNIQTCKTESVVVYINP